MPLSIEYARYARFDLEEIWRFVSGDSPHAAAKLLQRFDTIFRNLADAPMIGRSREEFGVGVRSFPYEKYVIFYRPGDRSLAVLRVLSSYREITPEMFRE